MKVESWDYSHKPIFPLARSQLGFMLSSACFSLNLRFLFTFLHGKGFNPLFAK